MEGFEDDLLFLGRDADAGVRDREGDDRFGRVEFGIFRRPTFAGLEHAQGNFAVLGELEGVREQVFEDLLQALRVGLETLRQVAVELDVEVELLVFGDVAEGAIDVILQMAERQFTDVDRNRAGFDLRKIENVVNEREEVDAGTVNGLGELDLFRREVALGVFGELIRQKNIRID